MKCICINNVNKAIFSHKYKYGLIYDYDITDSIFVYAYSRDKIIGDNFRIHIGYKFSDYFMDLEEYRNKKINEILL